MSTYLHVLAALDLSPTSATVLGRAVNVSRRNGARLSLMHVVEIVPVEPSSDALVPVIQVNPEALDIARRQLAALAAESGVPDAQLEVSFGNVKSEILRKARDNQADLVVLGCRARHGLSALVNLIEDTVLHGAPGDVLAVRLSR